MAYIGQSPVDTFSPVPSKDSFTGDGSTTTFDLQNAVVNGGENALEVFVNNVRQEPGSGKAFTLGPDGSNAIKRITFSAAPASGAAIYVINDKTSNTSIIRPTDLNGTEFILDADADTSLTADTDDRIDIKLANTDHISFGTSSGDTVIKPMTDAKDIIFQQYDGNKVLEINDGGFVGVGGNSNAAGEIRIYEDTDDGSHYVGFKAGNNTASVSYVLPTADGTSGYQLTTDGSGTLSWAAAQITLANDGNNRIVTGTGSSSLNAEANATFDGSTLAITGAITASTDLTVGDDLSLDSDAAVLNFGDDQDVNLTHVADTGLLLNAAMVIQFRDSGLTIGSNADGDLDIVSDGTAVDSINIESAGGITLDAGTAGNGIVYEDDGTEMMRIHNSSSDVILESKVSDKDIIFKVNDGGSATEVFRVDGDVSALLVASGKELRFADSGEKISGNGTDLTLNSGADINLTATADVNIPSAVGVTFGDDGEKIEGDRTDLTIASSAKINLTATSDVHIPNNVGIVFGGDSEKIEGDGTDMTISANNLTVDAAADITLDAAGNDLNFAAGGTTVLTVSNSSSDVVIKPVVDTKDLIFQQRDGTEVMRIEDGAHASFAAAAVNPEATLTDASTISWNVLTSPVAKVTLGANRTLGAGSGGIAGQFVSLLVIQDGTGSRTLSFNAVYEFKDDTAPTLTTTASKGDLFVFRYNGSKFLEVGRNQNLTLS